MCPDHGAGHDGCSICGGAGTIWTQNQDRQLLRCASCGFAWVPQGVARTATGQSIYEGDAPVFFTDDQRDYYRDEVTAEAARAKLAWVARYVPAGRTLLDVGANFGHFLREAQQRYAAVGIEPSAAVVAWGREHMGVPLETGSIEDEMPAYLGRFDAVTLFDVVEHLQDPRDALRRCRRYMTAGGHLFITTPDTSAPVARLLGSHWYYIDLLEHVSLFSAANLARLLGECGFRVVERRTIGRRYRVSYIERRLRDLSRDSRLLRAASLAVSPLRLATRARVTLNLGDVIAVTAVAA
jgi:2-polyprenyl-3-methyl-5-hydroxy-6-metoxy-1,4-benzoquinol methylase